MNLLNFVKRPTFLINESIAKNNIQYMVKKADQNHVRFRPHFKTHQSKIIGEWYQEAGVQSITVSSVLMANYFADAGWKDILIAFPVNLLELNEIILLSQRVKLGLLVDSEVVYFKLAEAVKTEIKLWIKIDTGYHRSGIIWDDFDKILSLVGKIQKSPNIKLQGILTHAGHTYHAQSEYAIQEIFDQTRLRLREVRKKIQESYNISIEISVGDTPGCKVAKDFSYIDEIRPGNFIFYDVQQYSLGVCTLSDIAVALACPVVSVYPNRNEAIIYGGAIHLSKDVATLANGNKVYGLVRFPEERIDKNSDQCYVRSLSQEHGVIQIPPRQIGLLSPGKLVLVYPTHSCLTLQAMQDCYTYEGKRIKTMLSVS